MTVEHHVFELEIFFMLIFVYECSFQFTLFTNVELFDLDLLGKIHTIL